jgi:hypothetical protein
LAGEILVAEFGRKGLSLDLAAAARAMISIPLRFVTISWVESGCVSSFRDGSAWASHPHETTHYHVIAHRCGYGDDILAYCREHDFFHHFCAEYLDGSTSRILWALAHDIEPSAPAFEEFTVQACQRWVRANERPIIGGVDWDQFKARAIWLLHQDMLKQLAAA